MIVNRCAAILVVCGFTMGCVALAAEPALVMKNSLESCLSIEPLDTATVATTVFLKTRWKNLTTTGECGCKSALIAYRVTNESGQLISSGLLSSLKKQGFDFVVNPDASVAHPAPLTLAITCAGSP